MASLSGSVRVVYVDDDSLSLSLLPESLDRVDGDFDVVTVEDPYRVPAMVADDAEVDCVVSDYDMPGMDGLDLFEAVREERPELPFILYTGKGSEEIASDAISAGVTDYLQKDSGTDHYELLANRVREYAAGYRTDQQFEHTRERYRRLVEQSVVGIALSQGGVFEYANPKMAELFGYEVDELVGTPVEAVIDESDHERVQRAIGRRERGEVETVHYVVTAKAKDGTRFDIEVSGSRVTYEGDPAVLGVVQPLDTRRKALANVDGSVVEELVASLQSAADDLSAADVDAERIADARESVVDAVAALRAESVVDLETACRETWEQSGVAGDIDFDGTLALVGQERDVTDLFETVWTGLAGEDATLDVTVTPGDHAFEVRIDAREDGAAVDAGVEPPGVGRVTEALGWESYVSRSDGGVTYTFEAVSRAPTPSSASSD